MSARRLPTVKPTEAAPWTDFLAHLRLDQGASENTVQSYRRDLEQFWKTRPRTEPAAITPEDIQDFLAKLSRQKMKTNSIARKISALRQFFRFLCAEKGLEKNPLDLIESPKLPERLPKA